ncbi:MAG TPA: RIP metalloprotease RseP [Candidatus Moranbacteria bacterium]|jgi:regulator of sigma E protease|nr:RIP metalloprotease RseP [Candidatus Moranbacteria bacterium]HOF42722.1 RIP metalloprotease RseP [Candidatus Moranbacteria bacterium]HPX94219.1 RIP metalloprotease RseP [Candidatus Moranbacteria bacterium]HQB59692.1 RIP metalloprotease RseP [Candidatus Moranbacteria bacterium]
MLTIITFVIILGILVFVHELGHFVVARRNGIKAEEFGFGFPPRAIGIQFLRSRDRKNPVKKWRIIWGSKDGDDSNEKKDIREARKKDFIGGTIYSLNWLPIGGFVKIKGEDGEEKKDKDSFSSKSAWIRVKVLAAGVVMNFILAWALLSLAFMIGSYEDVTGQNVSGSKILIESIEEGSPADTMGLMAGDILVRGDGADFSSVTDVQEYISKNRGKEVKLTVQRGNQTLELSGTPRESVGEGKGLLGIAGFGEVVTVRYSLFQSLWRGLQEMGYIFVEIGRVFAKLMQGERTGVEVMGPVKLAIFTGQILPLGFIFLLRFIAIFSINLGIINILPFPALDGGRILFIVIEKIKGSPVSQKVEQAFHSVGMFLLLGLMLYITLREIFTSELLDKIR